MPKIPTFTTQVRPTAETASVTSNVSVPLNTIADSLSPVTKAITKHAIAEKDLENKTEALKLENESLLELTDVFEEASKLDNKDQAASISSIKIKNYTRKIC